jgi:glyoxylase-like metal-dependent hydrolase (beta-lactamase superfamily II)
MNPDPIYCLNLPRGNSVLHPTLIVDHDLVLLVDTGLPGTLDDLEREFVRLNLSLDHVTAVMITHHDIDHMGNLKALKARNPKLTVITSEGEVAFVEGRVPAQKLQDMASGKLVIGEDQKAWADNLARLFPTLSTPVDEVVQDGDVLTIADGLEVIATPGHTVGHISLYHHATQTLISGDALNLKDGALSGPNPRMTHDLDVAHQSLKRLVDYPIRRILAFHGGVLEGRDLPAQLRNLATLK